jgi:hypothetical protein
MLSTNAIPRPTPTKPCANRANPLLRPAGLRRIPSAFAESITLFAAHSLLLSFIVFSVSVPLDSRGIQQSAEWPRIPCLV